ncbi:hypothetical protein LTR36_003445 [Oleoguttula mirabilis]|uniref:Protein SMG7 n=1 Tax=Oleoguttula mirabilis TaxID=1507867 RepID=A0AAV9JJX8_9PEZI|nr:hypothetical protein LTR36_003445 [Oleoguttula mirabilis]
MDDLFAQERAAEQHVYALLKDPDQPIGNLLAAYEEYRLLCQANVLASDIAGAEKREARLWLAHTEGKRFFSTALKRMRKSEPERPVETRHLIKLYLHFLKGSERFYRGYIHNLSTRFGGIPELEAVAQKVKSNGGAVGESSQSPVSPEQHAKVLGSCHQALIYLGDLSRYRASEQLDKKPDFGPALGYYGLACTLRPSSGMGHHQQAVVALEQRHHLRAIYHLYRAIVVADPHPNAANNLKLEFDKVNSAFRKGELLPKSAPNDPEGPKRMLTAWFVRMHSMCSKGEQFKEHKELEQTLMDRLVAVIKHFAVEIDTTLMRMVMVNLAAQYNAMEMFQDKQTPDFQQAFFYFLQLNIKTYTTLLELFNNELRALDNMVTGEDEPKARLTPTIRRILPALRVYSAWLLPNVQIVAGLASDATLEKVISSFWQVYTRAIALVADEQVFGIWALEEFRAPYMLEEDTDTLGFKPVQNEWTKVWRNWFEKDSGAAKPRFSDPNIVRMSLDEEMLTRVMGLLDDGMHLAYEVKEAPITLLGTTVYNGEPPESDVAAYQKGQEELKGKPWPKPKPLSYAAAAAKSRAQAPLHANMPNGAPSTTSARSRQAQLIRMVDDLVDDDDSNNPVTPPQQHASNPIVVTNGDVHHNGVSYGAQDFAAVTSYQPKLPSTSMPNATRSNAPTPPTIRTSRNSLGANSIERLQSVSTLWNDTSAQPMTTSPNFPTGLPTGTLSSPAQIMRHGHSRVNSASSIRSRTSQNVTMGESWSSIESSQRVQVANGPMNGYTKFSASGMASPLLFGAGNNMWNTGTGGYRNVSPPNGQGG